MRSSPSILVMFSVLLAVGAQVGYGQSFSSPINLSSTPDLSSQQQIAASGSNVYVAWSDGAFGSKEILFKASTDGGSTFTAQQNLSSNASNSLYPQIAALGSNVYVVWQDGAAGNSKIFFRVSHDFGATFDAVQNLSALAGGYSLAPQVAASASNVYVVWEEALTAGTEIFFKASADNGSTFPVQTMVSNNGVPFPAVPQVAAAGANVYVAWEAGISGSDIFFTRSTNNGTAFNAVQNLSANAGFSGNTRLAASGNNIYVVWQDDTLGNNEIFFRASGDSGSTFNPPLNSSPKNISNNSGFSGYPSIAVSQNNVYLVWLDSTNTNGDDDIFFSRSTDNGLTFGVPINMSNSPGSSQEQDGHKVVASGTFVSVIWQNENPAGPFDIFVESSADNGVSFGSAINLSNNASNSILPGIAASGCSVYAVWQDDATGNRDIFFAASMNSGGSGANLQGLGQTLNLSNDTGGSNSQRMAVSCSNVYVVWIDNTPGSDHAFFSASYDNGATFGPTIDLTPVVTGLGQPAIAASGHNIYVVWSQFNSQNQSFDIYFRVSTNEGLSFAPAINLSNNPGGSFDVQVAAGGGNVFVVWRDLTPGNNEVLFTRSTNDGVSFDVPTNISNTPGFSDRPQIAASGSNVFVAWSDNNTLLFKASTNGGSSFGQNVTLSGNNGILNPPQIAAAGSNVYLAWDSFVFPGPTHAFFITSSNAGASFGNAIDLSPKSTSGSQPQMAVSGSNVYMAWSDTTSGNSEVLFRPSKDNGATFGNATNLSNNSGESGSQRIAASGNNVYITWRDASPGNYEVFLIVSNDGGAGFSSVLNLSNNASGSDTPQIVVSDANVCVSWRDNLLNNDEIFLRAGVPPVAGVQSATGAGPVSFSTDAGGFSSMTAVPEANLPQAGKPQGVTFPYGFFDWKIVGLTPGQTVTVTITYPNPIPSPAQYWKVINGVWTQMTPPQLDDDDGDNILTLTITDGGTGDADGLVNGEISDPGGVALVVVPVTIDIKPGTFPNSINPKEKGVVPVAILTTGAFNAATVDPATVRFGVTGTEAAPVHFAFQDVNGDGSLDMLLQFNVQDTAIQCGMTSATLTGKTKIGRPIKGSDSLVTVGCK
jgi:hypothetical protein